MLHLSTVMLLELVRSKEVAVGTCKSEVIKSYIVLIGNVNQCFYAACFYNGMRLDCYC